MNMSTNYSMITMVPLHKRMEPAKHVNNNGAYSPGWNPRVFYQKSMTYYTIQGYGDIRFVFIESYRDRLLHLTVYRMLSQTGVVVHVNCMDVTPHINL
jgi:hypothetical protein